MLLSLPDGRTVRGEVQPRTRSVFVRDWTDIEVGQSVLVDGLRRHVACVRFLSPRLAAIQLLPLIPSRELCAGCEGFWSGLSCRITGRPRTLKA